MQISPILGIFRETYRLLHYLNFLFILVYLHLENVISVLIIFPEDIPSGVNPRQRKQKTGRS